MLSKGKVMSEKKDLRSPQCTHALLSVRDALDVLTGKWKIPILIVLMEGEKRFGQMAREIPGITDKMLSKELKELEMHQLVTRKVVDTFPPTVIYSRTDHAESLSSVIDSLKEWGAHHRKTVIG